MDGTLNKQGNITHCTYLEVQMGGKRMTMCFFLTDLGEHKIILGYPWFATVQPKIDWAQGWIDYAQLPVILRTHNAHRAVFGTRFWNEPQTATTNCLMMAHVMVPAQDRQTMALKLAQQNLVKGLTVLPDEYK